MNKTLATTAILMLLFGTFGLAFNFAVEVAAADTYKYLTVGYSPDPMAGSVIPDMAPPVGTHNYTLNSVINVTAPMYVSVTTGVRYEFDHFFVWNEETNATWTGPTGDNQLDVTMNANKTITAFYNIQYELTVITTYDVPNIWDSGVWYENTSSRWFDANATAYAGVMKNNPNDWMSIGVWARAYLINWTGDATGKIDNIFWHSDAITMDGPKTAIAEWEVRYYLWTDPDSEYDPWGPGSNEYDPDKRGYYADTTDVDLTAPSIDNENPGKWRWRFDHWVVERWNGTAWIPETLTTENITVHLGPPTKATVHFYLQYYLTVSDSPSMLDTGLESYSGYYDYCTNVTIVAPDPVPDPSNPGIRWMFDQWFLSGVFDVYNTTVTVHIEHATTVDKTLYAIYTKEYWLEVQDNIGGLSGVSAQSGWFTPSSVVPLSAPSLIPVDSGTRYVFVEWVKDPGHYTDSNPNTTITMASPRNATAYYKKQYKRTWSANIPGIPGFPGEDWQDEYALVWWGAPTGPIASYPFDYYFDHWEMNGVPQAQYANWVQINMTGPINGVATYVGMSAFFVTPQMVIEDAPAESTTFTVNVTAANLVDLYAFDFNVTWNPNYLELVAVDVEVDEIWTNYFIAKNEINNTAGYYWLVATSLDDYGFNGTHKIVALTFHIIYDPCYIATNHYVETDLDLNVNLLTDHEASPLMPHNVHGGYYRINAIQPTIEMRPGTITASQKDYIFTVEIWIVDAIKLHDWYAFIEFNTAHLDILDVEIDTTFLTGPYELFYYAKTDNYNGTHGSIEIHIRQQQPGEVLAYGEGRLAVLTFMVNQTIFWTTSDPILQSWIAFGAVYISVKCPTYEEIWPPLLEVVNAEYKYDPIPGDVNMDGVVNVLDLQLVAGDYGSSTTYDLDEDADVDLRDLVLVAINFGRDEP